MPPHDVAYLQGIGEVNIVRHVNYELLTARFLDGDLEPGALVLDSGYASRDRIDAARIAQRRSPAQADMVATHGGFERAPGCARCTR